MDAKELRIGNIVQDAIGLEKELIVYRLEDGVITCGNDTFSYPYLAEQIKPVPLNEELLVKYGFVKSESMDDEKRVVYRFQVENNNSLYFDNDNWYISHVWNNNHFQNTFWIQPEYIHQLQNLIYSLTGKELEL